MSHNSTTSIIKGTGSRRHRTGTCGDRGRARRSRLRLAPGSRSGESGTMNEKRPTARRERDVPEAA